MRFVGVLFAVAITACPAYAQTAPAKPKPAAAKPAAKPAVKPAAPARAGYAALTDSERMAIQSDLIWTGDYNGVIAAELNDRAIVAVKAFQKRHGGRETGILTAEERAKLAQEAKPKQDNVGWRLVDDGTTGAWLGLPAKLVPQASAGKAGSHWQSGRGETQVDTFRIVGTTLAAAFERLKKEPPERKVEYNVVRGDFFVISGLQGLKKFYVRAQIKDAEVRGITILYDQAMEGIMDPITVAMSNAFFPFPTGQFAGVLPPGPPPRRKVEYGSGIVVSAIGHIVTDRQITEGCQSITVPGLGHAERIAVDRASDLALLRVYGAHDLNPAALGSEPARPSVTLIGIADPQVQSGGSAVTSVPAQVAQSSGALRPVEPAPALGFSGSAAVDTDAKVLGMVGLKAPETAGSAAAPRAALVSADLIRAFLYAQSVAPRSGQATIEETKAAVVRVICVRR